MLQGMASVGSSVAIVQAVAQVTLWTRSVPDVATLSPFATLPR